jgi:hypothetical protein
VSERVKVKIPSLVLTIKRRLSKNPSQYVIIKQLKQNFIRTRCWIAWVTIGVDSCPPARAHGNLASVAWLQHVGLPWLVHTHLFYRIFILLICRLSSVFTSKFSYIKTREEESSSNGDIPIGMENRPLTILSSVGQHNCPVARLTKSFWLMWKEIQFSVKYIECSREFGKRNCFITKRTYRIYVTYVVIVNMYPFHCLMR